MKWCMRKGFFLSAYLNLFIFSLLYAGFQRCVQCHFSHFASHSPWLSFVRSLHSRPYDKWSDTHSRPPFFPTFPSDLLFFFHLFTLSRTAVWCCRWASWRWLSSAFYLWIKKTELSCVEKKTSNRIFPVLLLTTHTHTHTLSSFISHFSFFLLYQNTAGLNDYCITSTQQTHKNHRWLMKTLPSEPISNVHKPRVCVWTSARASERVNQSKCETCSVARLSFLLATSRLNINKCYTLAKGHYFAFFFFTHFLCDKV